MPFFLIQTASNANNRSELLHLQSEALGALLGQFFSCYKPTASLGAAWLCQVTRAEGRCVCVSLPLNPALRLIQSLHLNGSMEHSPQVEGDTGMEQVEQVGWMPLTAIPLLQKSPWGRAEVHPRGAEPVPTSHANVLA